MNIAMFTNAYPPHVGGVSKSVSQAVDRMGSMGHQVLVVAPKYGEEDQEEGIIRLQSIKNVSDSDFSLPLPFSIELSEQLAEFNPDIIHSHYPMLIGDMALRYGALKHIPVVFTHHTRYEAYDGLLPWDVKGFESFVKEVSTGYANLCTHVIVPTRGMIELLKKNGVKTPISAIPTGVNTKFFSTGNGRIFRKKYDIEPDRFVVGYTGRIAPEKNLMFWADAVCSLLKTHSTAHALLIGQGSCDVQLREKFEEENLGDRVTMPGVLTGQSLVNAYSAMDIFAFTSLRETQGLAVVEALAAGCPVVALDVRCVRDVISDGEDGHLVKSHTPEAFSKTLEAFAKMSYTHYKKFCSAAEKNARRFDIDSCINKTLKLYGDLIKERKPTLMEITGWHRLGQLALREMKLWINRVNALGNALFGTLGKRK